MASTVVAPVSNNFTLAQKYVPLLDAVYKRESLTSMFDAAQVDWTGVDTVKVYTLETLGFGNYDRGAGFVPGNLTGAWETFQVTQDRGRSFLLDYLDNEESMSVPIANALNEFERVQMIPEVDSYRISKWAGTSGIDGAAADITSSTVVKDLIAAAEASMDDNEVPYEGRILYVNPSVYQQLKGEIDRRIINSENNVNENVEYFDDMRIIRVPSARFNTAITLANPTTAAGVGGYTQSGKAINFMIVHPTAVFNVIKHYAPRIFTPAQNIEADGWLIQPRLAHDTFVFGNKKKGIYVHKAVT